MTREAGGALGLARTMLDKGHRMLRVDLFDEAGRAGYLAAFHPAQAFLFDRLGKAMKTHAGVQSEFGRVARAEAALPEWLHGFLSNAFEFKAGAEYGTGPRVNATRADAERVLRQAAEFVAIIESALGPLERDGKDDA